MGKMFNMNNGMKGFANLEGFENAGKPIPDLFGMSMMTGKMVVNLKAKGGSREFFSFDPTTKQLTAASIATINMPMPGIVMPTPFNQIKVGMVVMYNGNPAFVYKVHDNAYTIIKGDGKTTRVVPVLNEFMGNQAFIPSVMNANGMMFGDQMGTQAQGQNPMANMFSNPLMMMAMMGGNSDEDGEGEGLFGGMDMSSLMMMSMLGGGGLFGNQQGQNPMANMFGGNQAQPALTAQGETVIPIQDEDEEDSEKDELKAEIERLKAELKAKKADDKKKKVKKSAEDK